MPICKQNDPHCPVNGSRKSKCERGCYEDEMANEFGIDEISLRDYFAAKAMQGICVNAGRNGYELDRQEQMAAGAYLLADAMLKARKA